VSLSIVTKAEINHQSYGVSEKNDDFILFCVPLSHQLKNTCIPYPICIHSIFCVPLPHQPKMHPLSFLCFTVPLAQQVYIHSLICQTSYSPFCVSVSHQLKNIPTLLFVSDCPTSPKSIHSPFCVSLSHQLINISTLFLQSHCPTSQKSIYSHFCVSLSH
jgi:hypothetical protein